MAGATWTFSRLLAAVMPACAGSSSASSPARSCRAMASTTGGMAAIASAALAISRVSASSAASKALRAAPSDCSSCASADCVSRSTTSAPKPRQAITAMAMEAAAMRAPIDFRVMSNSRLSCGRSLEQEGEKTPTRSFGGEQAAAGAQPRELHRLPAGRDGTVLPA